MTTTTTPLRRKPADRLRLAYLGTSDFAATVLRHLARSAFSPVLVVAPPDRKQGRGRKLSAPPVATLAAELGLELHQTPSVNQAASIERIEAAGVDCGLVCAFGQLIKPPLLERVEMLNVHPSLLPRWRGAAPIERAIMAGDEETGVAIMRLTEGLDSGPVARVVRVPIERGEDFGSLSSRLAALGGELVVGALALRAAGALDFTEQGEGGVTYADKIEPGERRLDPDRSADELERVVRALNPHIGTFLELEGGERLGVVSASREPEGDPGNGVLAGDGETLLLGTASGGLRLSTVRPPGKRDMTAADYLRGHSVPRLAG